ERADLIRQFNAMATTVQGFNTTLEREVARATEKARAAEAAAMTQRRLAATGELAAGVAHEINNPLGGLLNAAESLASEDLSEAKRSQYQALLHGGLERIQATVGRLLRLAPRAARPQPIVLLQPVHERDRVEHGLEEDDRLRPIVLLQPVLDAIALVQHRAGEQEVAIEFT